MWRGPCPGKIHILSRRQISSDDNNIERDIIELCKKGPWRHGIEKVLILWGLEETERKAS